MEFAIWSSIVGALLVLMTLGGTMLARLPLSTAMLYLLVGLAVGPWGLELAWPDPFAHTRLIEHVTEIVVLLSLFTSGLKMSAGLADRRWRPPLRLALLSMVVTVGLIAAIGVYGLGLPIGAAVLLGGVLAPTDPVLATAVQLSDPKDRDQLRYALTGEGGLNDGTAFPFVMLGLGLLGLHEIGDFGWRWVVVDVVWASVAGLAIGGLLGHWVGRLVLYLRRTHRQAIGYDNFLALGLIAVAYGFAILAQGYGFLAVFAAGLALRHTEQRDTAAARGFAEAVAHDPPVPPPEPTPKQAEVDAEAAAAPSADAEAAAATHPKLAPSYMAHAVMSFNEQLDRVGEMVGVVLIGMLLWAIDWLPSVWWFVPVVLLLVRPVAVAAGLAGSHVPYGQRALIGWFGIRGIGSVYYLSYAINHGLDPITAKTLLTLMLAVVVTSIVVHGISVTPLMQRYRARRGGGSADAASG